LALADLILPRVVEVDLEVLLVIVPDNELAERAEVAGVLSACVWIDADHDELVAILLRSYAMVEDAN